MVGDGAAAQVGSEVVAPSAPRVRVMLVDDHHLVIEGLRAVLSTDDRVIMLTMYENPDYLFEAVKAGASGYVLKDVAGVDLLQAIHTVAEGGSLLNQEVVGRFLRRLAAEVDQRSTETPTPPSTERLTPRELDVLRLITAGMSNKEIAVRLSVTVATVKTHLEHILQKLQVSDRTQAAVHAVTHGLLN